MNRPSHLLPCGCLPTHIGAHRSNCPDYQTVYPPNWSGRVEDLAWRPRTTENAQ